MPASWMSRNRCHALGATSPAVCTSPRIAQMSAMTSLTVTAGLTVPAVVARGEQVDRRPYSARGCGVGRALQEQAGIARMICEGLAEGAQQLFKSVSVGARQRLLGGTQNLLQGQPEELIDQGVLAGKPAVPGPDAHAGPDADLRHAGAAARLA